MPNFLIVAATKIEVETISNHFNIVTIGNEGLFNNNYSGGSISILITGVGMVNTAFNMGKYLRDNYDYVINVGICGAFNKNLCVGEIVNITSDLLSEMGAENDEKFINYSDLNLGGSNSFKSYHKVKYTPLNSLKKVYGITVNTVHGNESTIKKTVSHYNPDVESMEGAAFLRACQNSSENYFQLRAVSNYVEKRDKSKWNIPLAITNVNDFVIKMINELGETKV